ncbi:MAG: hypothetical protein JWN56_1293 [Sphingobacteriales bacterium]|nr:hypothetical protein [Sphingobacteriales bacterium]
MKKRLFAYALLILVGLSYCTTTTDKENNKTVEAFENEDSIESFWKWFSKNQTRFRDFKGNPTKSDIYLNEILAEGRKIKDGLAFELELPKEGTINLTVSANGDTSLFSKVQEIVSKAPKIQGWRVLAFRQRISESQVTDMVLKTGNHTLDPKQIAFLPIISGKTLDIIVYVPDITEENRNEVANGSLMLLDNILGEYDCVKKVRSYDFQSFPSDKRQLLQLQPLTEIAKYVDAFHADIK